MIFMLCLLLSVFCAIFWRMGGSENYNKLWRRIGSSLCIIAVILSFSSSWTVWLAVPFIFYGCISYSGWVSDILVKLFDEIEVGREYWWNFFVENLSIQLSVLFVKPTISTFVMAVCFALFSAVGKVVIDMEEDGSYEIFGVRVGEDVLSELWHGFSNCTLVACNLFI